MQTEEELLNEISRLKNAISRQNQNTQVPVAGRDSIQPPYQRGPFVSTSRPNLASREVVIDGVAFQSSGRSLVRKGAVTSSLTPGSSHSPPTSNLSAGSEPVTAMVRTTKGSLVASSRLRAFKRPFYSKPSVNHHPGHLRGSPQRGRGRGRGRGASFVSNRLLRTSTNRRLKRTQEPIDKQCREFTRRGICLNGLNCRYKHSPDQVAICPKYLNDECSLPDGTCPLSHNPTPERVPVCVHFANGARCRNGTSCKYPHVRLGRKDGICRDFAVLGYCAKGLDCDHQHVRECPDFAESGTCPTKGCRLPHVIRAQHRQPTGAVQDSTVISSTDMLGPEQGDAVTRLQSGENSEDFIPLTFDESSEDESDDDVDEDEDPDGGVHKSEEAEADNIAQV